MASQRSSKPVSVPSPHGRKPRTATTLTAPASRLLRRIAAAGDGGLTGQAEPVALAELLERELVVVCENGAVVTSLGRARLARESGGEHGFLAQHASLGRRSVEASGVTVEALVDLDESPLAWLARRKGRDGRPLLESHEVLAGERLRADFTRGQMSPRVTANWSGAASSGRRGGAGTAVDMADAVLAARERVARAIDAVGPELSGALLDVCCFLKGLEEVEKSRGWPARGGKLVLGLALARLARHYGYGDARGPAASGRIVGWAAADNRPSIDGV